MTRYVGTNIEVYTQVVDSNGAPVTGATLSYNVIFDGESTGSGTMQHVADGIYVGDFTPAEAGEYAFEVYNEALGFRKTYSYHAENMPADLNLVQQISNGNQIINPNQNQWYNVITENGGLEVYSVSFYQLNNEAAAKDIEVRIYHVENTLMCPQTFQGQEQALIFATRIWILR